MSEFWRQWYTMSEYERHLKLPANRVRWLSRIDMIVALTFILVPIAGISTILSLHYYNPLSSYYSYDVEGDFCRKSSSNSSGLYIFDCKSGFEYHNPIKYRHVKESK